MNALLILTGIWLTIIAAIVILVLLAKQTIKELHESEQEFLNQTK